MNGVTIINMLPPYKGEERLLKHRQATYDIIAEILRTHASTAKDYNRIASMFWKGSAEETARNLFNFMKQEVIYGVEAPEFQSVKTPAAILTEGKKYGGDCKHYALFIVGVAEALRRMGYMINAYYRFASYNDSKNPGHVFAVVVDPGTGAEYWTDPVLPAFNQRTPAYKYAVNKIPQRMDNSVGELYAISGIGAVQTTRQETADGTMYSALPAMHWTDYVYGRVGMTSEEPAIGKFKFGQLLKKYNPAMVPLRNAFLALMKINFGGLAVKFNAAHKKDGKKVDKWWQKFGGNPNKLHTAMHQGTKWYNKLHHKSVKLSGIDESMNGPGLYTGRQKYTNGNFSNNYAISGLSNVAWMSGMDLSGVSDEISGIDEMSGLNNDSMISGEQYHDMGFAWDDMREMKSVGFAPAAIPALLAAATPIIVAAKNMLKSFGINTSSLNKHTAEDGAAETDTAETHNAAVDKGDVDADGSVDHGAGVKTKKGKDKDGAQVMEMDVEEDGGGGAVKGGKKGAKGGAGGDEDGGGEEKGLTKGGGDGGGGGGFLDTVKQSFSDHKALYIGGAVTLITVPILIKVFSGHKKGRR